MSELQAALLSIGIGVIVAVYGYGWWQQRQYRRKFGAAFRGEHADALYQQRADKLPVQQPEPQPAAAEAVIGAVPPASAEAAAEPDVTPVAVRDELCAALDARSDFIIDLQLAEPAAAAVLDGLWQRKFDFGKPLYVCGLTLQGGQWERAIADGHTRYVRLRAALQLVDRGGAVNINRLTDFRDLVLGVAKHIKADTTAPEVNAMHQHALKLDALCAEVDQMVGLNLIPSGDRLLLGAIIARAAALSGMTLEADGAFHLLDAQGHSLYSLSNMDSKPFQHHTLDTTSSDGITLLLDVPRVELPAAQFDQMVLAARQLAAELQLNVVDDHRVLLSAPNLTHIRDQIAAVEAKMLGNGIVPGSAQARRLFA